MLNLKVRSKHKSPNQRFPKCSQSFRDACQFSSSHPALFFPSWELRSHVEAKPQALACSKVCFPCCSGPKPLRTLWEPYHNQ